MNKTLLFQELTKKYRVYHYHRYKKWMNWWQPTIDLKSKNTITSFIWAINWRSSLLCSLLESLFWLSIRSVIESHIINLKKLKNMQKVITKKIMRILMPNPIKNRKTSPQKLPKKPKNPNPKRLPYQNSQNPRNINDLYLYLRHILINKLRILSFYINWYIQIVAWSIVSFW